MTQERSRPLPYWVLAVAVAVHLAIIQVGGIIGRSVAEVSDEGSFTTVEGVLVTVVAPPTVALVFVYGVAAALGRLRPVLVDDRHRSPTRHRRDR